jgi:hypothetical protein
MGKTLIDVIDIAFLGSKDILIILRSDLCIEYLELKTRSNINLDSIERKGIQNMSEIYTKICIYDTPKEPIRFLYVIYVNMYVYHILICLRVDLYLCIYTYMYIHICIYIYICLCI